MSKKAVLLLVLLDIIIIAKAQDTAGIRFPRIHFQKKSSVLTTGIKEKLDSVIAIAIQYPSKYLMVVTPFGWENESVNKLILKRTDRVFGYLEQNNFKKIVTTTREEGGFDKDTMYFELVDDTETLPHPSLIKNKND